MNWLRSGRYLIAPTPAANPTSERCLDYDTLGRLTALKYGTTETVIDGYSDDATGNRLSAKVAAATQAYTYPNTNHRPSAVAGVAQERGQVTVRSCCGDPVPRRPAHPAANQCVGEASLIPPIHPIKTHTRAAALQVVCNDQ